MGEALRILFFGASVLLTPTPVTLSGDLVIEPNEPIEAITSGAYLEVDVSGLVKWNRKRGEGIVDFRERLAKLAPAGSISATLYSRDHKSVTLAYRGAGGITFNDEGTWLLLTADGGVPLGTKFTKVVISSKVELKNVLVKWNNSTK